MNLAALGGIGDWTTDVGSRSGAYMDISPERLTLSPAVWYGGMVVGAQTATLFPSLRRV
jgi:hypothetical protein